MAKVDIPGTFANENEEYECQDCGETFAEEDLITPIPDLEMRVAAGEVMPAGECPECGALCHKRDTAADVTSSPLAEIEDVIVNQYGEDQEPFTKRGLREILDAIVAILDRGKK